MKINKVLVANRGEIAIRIFRACTEIGLRTVGVYTYEDRYSLHRYKADESYQIGADDEPLKPYLNIDAIIKIAKENNVDAIHPGYGFLSENAKFAQACEDNGIIFIGPKVSVLRALGDKITAKQVAVENNIPIIESNKKALEDIDIALSEADQIGYPVMLKAASGGGGRGMRVIRDAEQLKKAYYESKREALNAFGDDTVFIEKYVENPKHIEIQIMADSHGNIVHLYERDCSVQRRYQKVIEFAPSMGLDETVKNDLYKYAIKICSAVDYNNVGTVEFLVDDDNSIYFIEVNPRIQVEHTVTEMITGIDIVKSQIFIAGGYKLEDEQLNIPNQESITTKGYALQCRITTEDPKNDFKPDYGTITTYRTGAGFNIRLDAGSVYQGATISPFFDSMLVKISAHSRTLDGACRRMRRALAEFRIRGVKTNIAFLDNILADPMLRQGEVTVNYIKKNPRLFVFKEPRNRATKITKYLGNLIVNGNGDVKNINPQAKFIAPNVPQCTLEEHPKGTKDKLTALGPDEFSKWLMNEKAIQYTDTTMRDAHQSLLATRMRTYDMMKVAPTYTRDIPNIFSMEIWGGATFDVCLRFLKEDPWERLSLLRAAIPNTLTQMLLRGSNGVGYTAYPDNLIEKFVAQAWETGVDVFRIFDSLNWMESIAPAIEHVRNQTQGLAEGAISYTGDILNPDESKYTLDYYIRLAKDIENAGAHILGVKDMAGLLKPYSAYELISALKDEINIPIHLHTHDTSSIQAATYMKAIEAGVDVIDVALAGMSGLTSQPNFNSVAEMMKGHERENKININKLNEYSNYWESVRTYYYPFESGLKAGTAEVYQHEIPGGQYSNLKPQAASLGLEDRFHEITDMYGKVNKLFGHLVKVTPSSKVVGDMAQYLISNNLSIEDVMEKGDTLSFPASVISFFRGELGQPYGGFPEKLQKIILKDIEPFQDRPNAHLEPIDITNEFEAFKKEFSGLHKDMTINDFLSYKLYPKVFTDYYDLRKVYGNVMKVPTKNFFYGMKIGEEILIELDRGKTLLLEYRSKGTPDDDGRVTVYFKVNGQGRNIKIKDESVTVDKVVHQKADSDNVHHIGSPLQGSLSKILVSEGDTVHKNQPLFVVEAMKMETTITSIKDAKIKKVVLKENTLIDSEDLILVLEDV